MTGALRLHEQHVRLTRVGIGPHRQRSAAGDTDAVLLVVEIDEHEKLKHDVEIYELPGVEEEEARTSKQEELWCLLNDKKERGKVAIDMAMEMGRANIAEILLDVEILMGRANLQPVADVDLADCAKGKMQHTVQWVVCFAELVEEALGASRQRRTALLNIFRQSRRTCTWMSNVCNDQCTSIEKGLLFESRSRFSFMSVRRADALALAAAGDGREIGRGRSETELLAAAQDLVGDVALTPRIWCAKSSRRRCGAARGRR